MKFISKRILCILSFLIVFYDKYYATEKKFGVGIVVGTPTGLSGKYFLEDKKHAIDGSFSISSNFLYSHVGYLWHNFQVFGKVEEGQLPLHYGLGIITMGGHFGIRGVMGVSYIFKNYPFDLFIELTPVLAIVPKTEAFLSGGIGGRYFFPYCRKN